MRYGSFAILVAVLLLVGCESTRAPAAGVTEAVAVPVTTAAGEARFQAMLRYTPVQLTAVYPSADGSESLNSTGTGFFYAEGDEEPRVWLVSNRHVVLGDSYRDIPARLVFTVRQAGAQGVVRRQLALNAEEIRARGRFVPNPRLDLCAIDVSAAIRELAASGPVLGVLQASDLASAREPVIDLAQQLFVAGYPFNLDDGDGHYPMVKAVTVSSIWGRPYGGYPGFLVDGNLFTGMSGSPVILRARPDAEQPLVVGVFSSTLYVRTPDEQGELTRTTNLHAHRVIYPDYIPMLIRDGVSYDRLFPTDTETSQTRP